MLYIYHNIIYIYIFIIYIGVFPASHGLQNCYISIAVPPLFQASLRGETPMFVDELQIFYRRYFSMPHQNLAYFMLFL